MVEARTATNGSTVVGKGFKDALTYVSRSWIPVNPDILKSVKTRLIDGTYAAQPKTFISDLKSDLALFSFCVRRLAEVAQPEERKLGPLQVIEKFELERLRQLLDVPEDKVSTHKYEFADELQALRFKHAIISAVTAEVVAEKADGDAPAVYSCAVMRQLGALLVSWNYPRTFQKAISSVAEFNNNLEAALARYLGFSPSLLGLKLALDWSENGLTRIGSGLQEMASHTSEGTVILEIDEETKYRGEQMAALCELGEAFARVNDPKHFAISARDWEKASAKINHYLGPKGITLLRERIVAFAESYKALSPKLIEFDLTPKASPRGGLSAYGKKLFEQNGHIKKCPSEVVEQFRKVYETLEEARVSIEGVNLLIKDLIPKAGFPRGCIYMTDRDGVLLVPKVKVGEADIARYKPLNSATTSPFSHPVLEALSCTVPIKQENVFMYGDLVSHVTGVFGTREKTGVLYLEMGQKILQSEGSVPLTYFKAIRQCLNDCLSLAERKG